MKLIEIEKCTLDKSDPSQIQVYDQDGDLVASLAPDWSEEKIAAMFDFANIAFDIGMKVGAMKRDLEIKIKKKGN